MRKILLFAVIALVTLSACTTEFMPPPEVEPKPSLVFSKVSSDSADYRNPDMEPFAPPKHGIISQEWRDDKLVVEAFIKTFCGGADIHGDFKIEDNRLLLLYDLEIGDVVTKCMGTHKVVYVISNLPKKEYELSIEKVKTDNQA